LSIKEGPKPAGLVKERLRCGILAEGKNRLLNVNEAAYIDYLVARYKVDPLVIDFNNPYLTDLAWPGLTAPPAPARPVGRSVGHPG
jgi:hypothetical protein